MTTTSETERVRRRFWWGGEWPMNSVGKTPSPCGAIRRALKRQWVAQGLRHRWYQSAALSPHGCSGMLPMQTCKHRQMNVLTRRHPTTHVLWSHASPTPMDIGSVFRKQSLPVCVWEQHCSERKSHSQIMIEMSNLSVPVSTEVCKTSFTSTYKIRDA